MKIISVILILMLFVSFIFIIYQSYKEVNMEDRDTKLNNVYQGPVPEGYDEQHFRETGETIKEVSE